MHGHLRLTRPDDAHQMRDLWSEAFSGATDFHLAHCVLPRPRDADGATTVGAFDANGRMLSMLRAFALTSAVDLAPHTELWPRMPPLVPTLLLKDAATRPDCQRQGLSGLLRFHLLKAAVASGFASTCGLMPSRGSRAGALSEVGYAAFGEAAQVDGLVARTGPWRLFVLDLSTSDALKRLRTMTARVGRRYPWWGEPPAWSAGQDARTRTPIEVPGSTRLRQ